MKCKAFEGTYGSTENQINAWFKDKPQFNIKYITAVKSKEDKSQIITIFYED